MAKGGNASTTLTGSPETFQHDLIGTFTDSSFPTGWSDTAQVTSHSTAPQPSAVVIETADAFGHPTKALATLPNVALSQGIYRPIEPSDFYMTRADVRVDQFSDIDPAVAVEDPNNPGFLLCGCPVGFESALDWPMGVTFDYIDGSIDPADAPGAGLLASAETHTWHLFSGTANVVVNIDLGVQVEEGKWYSVETDFNASNGALHGQVIDATTGLTLADKMVFVTDPKYAFAGGTYDPSVDGVFNTEAYNDGEVSLSHTSDPDLNKPGLAVIDNIDTSPQHPGIAFDHAIKVWDSMCSDHG
jgi:hypothetical protein